MLISSLSFKRLHYLLFGILFTPIHLAVVVAAVPTSSIKMPKASQSLLLDVELIGSKIVTVGERGHVLISNDQGESWSQANVPVVQMLNAVDFYNENLGWAVGHDGNIIHTEDGGMNWFLQRDGLKAQNEANITSVSLLKAKVNLLQSQVEDASLSNVESESVKVDADSAFSFNADDDAPLTLEEKLDEAKWELENAQERLDSPVITPPLMDVWFSDSKNGWAVGAFGTLLQTTDSGYTWSDRSKSIKNPDGYHLNAVIGAGDTLFVGGEAGYLVYSKDNGETWSIADIGYDGTIFGMFAASDGSFVIATGLRGNTFKSVDGGMSWSALSPGVDYSLSNGAAYQGNNIVLVGTGGSVAVSNDNGDSHFVHHTLPARASLSAVIVLESGEFLFVGQGGVHRFDISSVAE